MGCCTSSSESSLDQAVERVIRRTGAVQALSRYHKLPRIISDDYVDLGGTVLGSGLNGTVHKAKSRATGTAVAVKSLRLRGLSGAKKRRLVKEVEVFLSMDHPHIARLLDVYETDDSLYLVMECLSGGELLKRLQEKGSFSEAHAADLAKQMLLVVSYLHGHNVVHRDLKLQNFLFETEGSDHLKLIDFGTSLILDQQLLMSSSSGTLGYMAPEVLDQTGLYTNKCDIWSLGVIIFNLLVGYMPFWGDRSQQLHMMRSQDPMKHGPQERWAPISADAVDLVRKMLMVSQSQRPSAHEMLQHRWFLSSSQKRSPLSGQIAKSLTSFAQASSFRRACMLMMAWSVTDIEQVEELRSIFLALDKNSSGSITFQELRVALEEKLDTSNCPLEEIFAAIDASHDKEIHYTEFLAAALSTTDMLKANVVAETFRRLDSGKTGFITVDGLQEFLGVGAECVSPNPLSSVAKTKKCMNFEDFQSYIAYEPPSPMMKNMFQH
eukprot:gnl/TRDRNA2_/TRDRNA2_175638_c1_seq1.p1 gnl/TRDRNA2_/TRDRNA2_175638_c1~~gnl/TRDRNA2_/TRDRNA2_175638_c1_seq1.p1  ORF type:complete len:493 (+),score=80.86 gnl/TRDRNA2_/TRDRNA2_175638_c1_seq1:48-1526(+)